MAYDLMLTGKIAAPGGLVHSACQGTGRRYLLVLPHLEARRNPPRHIGEGVPACLIRTEISRGPANPRFPKRSRREAMNGEAAEAGLRTVSPMRTTPLVMRPPCSGTASSSMISVKRSLQLCQAAVEVRCFLDFSSVAVSQVRSLHRDRPYVS